MSKTVLNFGTATNINVGFNSELKENRSMEDGEAIVLSVDLQTKTNEETSAEYPAIAITFEGVEGGGCYDTITSRTPSKTVLGLDRLKYLFRALATAFPELAYFIFAKQGEVTPLEADLTNAILEALTMYADKNNKTDISDVAIVNEKKEIIFVSLTKFREVLGKDSPIEFMYAQLGIVGKIRADHKRDLRKETDAIKREALKQAYYAKLDAQPVVPCSVNIESFKALYDACANLPKDVTVRIKTGNDGRQASVYEVVK